MVTIWIWEIFYLLGEVDFLECWKTRGGYTQKYLDTDHILTLVDMALLSLSFFEELKSPMF